MVARNWEDYYHVALRLATTPYVYEKTRHALIHARATCALYDTQKWVREWQRGVHILRETRILVDEDEIIRARGGCQSSRPVPLCDYRQLMTPR